MSTAWLSLGSNLAPADHLARAARALRQQFGDVVFSPVYRTPAVGFEGPDFLNAAAMVHTGLSPVELNDWLHALEQAFGRDRSAPRFSSRPLDIDIVFYDALVMQGPDNLRLPRPELQHAFVLKPLCDIAPGYRVPGDGRTLAELWSAHPDSGRPPARMPLDLDQAAATP